MLFRSSARTSLLSRAPARTGGSFALTLATTERALDVAVPAQPPDSTLVLTGATTHAPVDARLPAAFEGAFVLEARGGGSVSPSTRLHVTQPAAGARGRSRSMFFRGVAEACCGRGVFGRAEGAGAGQRVAE